MLFIIQNTIFSERISDSNTLPFSSPLNDLVQRRAASKTYFIPNSPDYFPQFLIITSKDPYYSYQFGTGSVIII